MSKLISTILIRGGSVLLILTAFLYLYLGYPYVSKGLSATNIDAALSGELKAIWLGFCLQLLFTAYLLLVNSRRSSLNKLIVVLAGLVVVADAVLVRMFIANTFGAPILMLSGLGILLGTFLWIPFERPVPSTASNN